MYCYQLHHDGYFQDGILLFRLPRLSILKMFQGCYHLLKVLTPGPHPGCQSAPGLFPGLSCISAPNPEKILHFALLIGWGFLLQSLRWIRGFVKNVPPSSTFMRFPIFQPLPGHKADMNQVILYQVGDPYISL